MNYLPRWAIAVIFDLAVPLKVHLIAFLTQFGSGIVNVSSNETNWLMWWDQIDPGSTNKALLYFLYQCN